MYVEPDPVMSRIDFELTEMLSAMRDPNCSFVEIGKRFNRDGRTVSRSLLKFDATFARTQGVHLIQRDAGQRGYRLTEAGRVFVEHLQTIPGIMKHAIEQATAATRRVPVICTSNCLRYWERLRQAIPDDAGFDIVPLPRRTAEIKLREKSNKPEAQVGLMSGLMEVSQRPAVGSVTRFNDRIDVLPLKVEKIQMITVDDLGLKEPVDVHDAIQAGVTFLTPNGGVAWDFLEGSFLEWYKLRPFQHVSIPDLEYGLRCLMTRAVRKSAMVVHGFNPEERKVDGLEQLRVLDFAPGEDRQMIAVTGVFYVRPLNEEGRDHNPQIAVWEFAKTLWTEREVTL